MATLQYWQGTMATLQYLSLIPTKCPSLRPHKEMYFQQRSRMSYRDSNLLLVRASLEDVSLQPSYQGALITDQQKARIIMCLSLFLELPILFGMLLGLLLLEMVNYMH
eukprot:TRINITY_DN3483_c0_g1_i1.p1 TRINITY_DN3483_c0_g1~~TRINITY_DN3483_c0_g1_i1.p1  ORF type:complete len:108 (+),score=9.81 TRINITY_DN3483_c0_g1_i1:217-540(+)